MVPLKIKHRTTFWSNSFWWKTYLIIQRTPNAEKTRGELWLTTWSIAEAFQDHLSGAAFLSVKPPLNPYPPEKTKWSKAKVEHYMGTLNRTFHSWLKIDLTVFIHIVIWVMINKMSTILTTTAWADTRAQTCDVWSKIQIEKELLIKTKKTKFLGLTIGENLSCWLSEASSGLCTLWQMYNNFNLVTLK